MTVIKLALVAAALGAAAHPTPKVVLVKHADFLRQSLAGATQYFVRTVSIGKEDLAAIRKSSDFTPADPDVQFYLGQGQDGKPVGATLFQQVDTPHGPLEVGLDVRPRRRHHPGGRDDGNGRDQALGARGDGYGADEALRRPATGGRSAESRSGSGRRLNGMPAYMAELIATAVGRGLVLYGTLYKGSAS